MAKNRKNKRMRKRLWFTATERVEVWDRWQRGESSQSIGRVLDRGGSAIHRQLAVCAGHPSAVPLPVIAGTDSGRT